MVSDERGGEGHRSGHGIYAGLSGLGVSYSCDIGYLSPSDDCRTKEASIGLCRQS